MKLSLIIALILTCQILTCQINYDFKPEKGIPESVKVIGIIASSVILEAIGDAKYDQGNKEIGKLYQAASVGILLASPFILDIDRKKWGWYFVSYLSFRIAVFDPVYNLTRGLPIDYIGTSSYWDYGMDKFNPPLGAQMWGRSMFLIVSISIPINKF